MRFSQLQVVGGIVAIGVLASLPFARPQTEVPDVPPAPFSPTLSSVPLHLPTEPAQSPAFGLRDHDPPPAAPPTLAVPLAAGKSHLDDEGMPPEMPGMYQPLLEGPAALPPVEPRALHVERPRVRVVEESALEPARTHRIVDGDTLARLAQRYWQDASLAEALYAANRQVLSAPDPLPIGVELTIPPRPATTPARLAPTQPSIEELPAPVRQPSGEVELDEPLVPIPRGGN